LLKPHNPDTEIVRILFVKGMAVNITQNLIFRQSLVAKELGVEVETAEPEAEARKVTEMVGAEDLEYLQRRPPVITIMGHVTTVKRHCWTPQNQSGARRSGWHYPAYWRIPRGWNTKANQQVVFSQTRRHEAFTPCEREPG